MPTGSPVRPLVGRLQSRRGVPRRSAMSQASTLPRARRGGFLRATGATLAVLAAAPALADDRYGYFSAVDGQATVWQRGSDDRAAVEPNYPLVPGDRLLVDRGGRVEAVLPDGNVLRIDSDSEVVFRQLAGAPGDRAEATQIELVAGNLQLLVVDDSGTWDLPRVDTVNATVYVQRRGTYRI